MTRFSREWLQHNAEHFRRLSDWAWRRATAASRVLPDFLIIGTMKGGTTSLYDYLCQHPKIASAFRKEVHYFDMHFTRGTNWYRANFPTRSEVERLGPGGQTGESTPYYLFHPAGPERLHKLLPDARLIVVLRNPVDRAVSHYFHSVRTGMDKRPIEVALDGAQPLVEAEHSRLYNAGYESDVHRMWSYLERGRYAEQLEAYLKVYRRDQLLVLRSEELFANPQVVVDRTTTFLGLEPIQLGPTDVKNQGSYEKSKDPLPAALRARLDAYFQPHNARLNALLGEDFDW